MIHKAQVSDSVQISCFILVYSASSIIGHRASILNVCNLIILHNHNGNIYSLQGENENRDQK